MLTDDHVRHLLAEAANTIKPGPEPEVDAPTRPRHVSVVAVVAVVVVAGGIAAASLIGHGGTPTSTTATSPSVTPTPVDDLYRGDTSFHLGADQIPAVAGYPISVATTILQRHGWVVSQRPKEGCPPNTATAVYPAPGTVTSPGTLVVLSVNANGSAAVPPSAAHQPTCPVGGMSASGTDDPFLLWAEGLAPAPRFAGGVQYADPAAGVNVYLGPADAQNATRWPHLSDLTTAATTPDVRYTKAGMRIVPHALVTGVGNACSSNTSCADRSIRIQSGHRTIMVLSYQLSSDGSIDAVTVDDRRTPGSQGTLPDVVGDSQAYATARLHAWGYSVTPVYRVDCAPAGVVSRLSVDGNSVIIGVTAGTGQCDDSALAPQFAHPATHAPGHRPPHRRTPPGVR